MEKSININKINSLLNQGLVPNELYYTSEKNKVIIDPEKIDYKINLHDHYANRLSGLDYLPGFNDLINMMANTSLTPLDEYNLRKNNINYYINE